MGKVYANAKMLIPQNSLKKNTNRNEWTIGKTNLETLQVIVCFSNKNFKLFKSFIVVETSCSTAHWKFYVFLYVLFHTLWLKDQRILIVKLRAYNWENGKDLTSKRSLQLASSSFSIQLRAETIFVKCLLFFWLDSNSQFCPGTFHINIWLVYVYLSTANT